MWWYGDGAGGKGETSGGQRESAVDCKCLAFLGVIINNANKLKR